MTDKETVTTPDIEQLIQRLQPQLDALEQERQALRRRALRWAMVIMVLALAAAVAAGAAMASVAGPHGASVGIVPLVFGVVLLIRLAYSSQRRWRDQVAALLLPEISAELVGETEYQAQIDRIFVKPYTELKLIGAWRAGEVKHLLRGKYLGRQFEMAHANLRAGGNDSGDSAVFKGLLLRIQLNDNIEPGLSIRPNGGWWSRAFGKQSIPTGNKEFDSVFLVGTDNNNSSGAEAISRIFTSEWQRFLLDLHGKLGNMPFRDEARISAGMKYDAFYLTVSLVERGRMRTLRERPFPDVSHVLAAESGLKNHLPKLIREVGLLPLVINRLPD